MAVTNIRYAGFAEGVAGTKPEPTFYIDANEVGLDAPTDTEMEVPSSLGMTGRAKRPGPYIPQGPITYSSDIGTLAQFYKWALGGYAYTAAAGTPGTETDFATHEVWANDERYFTEFCARIGKDEFEDVFDGCVIAGIETAIEREFVTKTLNIIASGESPAALKDVETDILPGLPEEYALAYHDVSLHFDTDGTGTVFNEVSDLAMNLNFGFDNNVDAERGVTLGSRFTRRKGSSGRSFSASTEMHFVSRAQRDAFWGSVSGPTKLGANIFQMKVSIDSGSVFADADNFGTAEIIFPRCYFGAVPLTTSGREEMSQGVAINIQQGKVTLEDGTTEVSTPFYMKVKNRRFATL